MLMASFPRHIARILSALALAVLASPGCTHVQLRKSTVVHSTTLSDIYTQQVLNNLAMFVRNPHALPFFAFPNQGTTQIQDVGSIGGPGYNSNSFMTSQFSLNASRQTTENWVLVPVSDPARLALMRCAYRQAIATTVGTDWNALGVCPDCKALDREFYGPRSEASGRTGSNVARSCLDSAPWFVWGCEKHTHHLRNNPCQLIGSYCGVYVCVPPEGREMLTRLTLAILDYAVNDAKQFEKRTKQVEVYLDKDGGYTTSDECVRKITATIPIDQPSTALRVLDDGTVWYEFQQQGFHKQDADNLIAAARKKGYVQEDLDKLAFWQAKSPESLTDDPHLRSLARFVKEHNVLPQNAPSDELLTGPATFQRKGAASAGLQSFGKLLEAASPPPSR
jgi:hypothetical protein